MSGPCLRILGLDPGTANLGVSRMELFLDGLLVLKDLTLIRTKASNKKLNIRAKSDDLRRLIEIEEQFRPLVTGDWIPHVVGFEESPSIRVSPRNTRNIGQVWGACHALATQTGGVLSFEYDPKALKIFITGSAKASKQLMIDTLARDYPLLETCGIPASKKEHVADAIAAAMMASQDTTVVQLLSAIRHLKL